MITGTSESKQPSAGYVDVPKFVGVGTIKIKYINPNNNILRLCGWSIPEDAKEPEYVTTTTLEDGTVKHSAKVRFLVELQEPEGKPIIAMDYWIHPEYWYNKEATKVQVIDRYGRTAWCTKDEFSTNTIPTYSTGPAKISLPFQRSHKGQEDIVRFLMNYLCCTPFEKMDPVTKTWKKTDNPGALTIDDWKSLCMGNAKELVSYVNTQPDNLLKVVFGVQKTEDNKVYQTFLTNRYLANNAIMTNGVYPAAENAINKIMSDGYHDNCIFSAEPISQYVITPTEVKPSDIATSDGTSTSAPTDAELDALFNEVSADPDDLPFF